MRLEVQTDERYTQDMTSAGERPPGRETTTTAGGDADEEQQPAVSLGAAVGQNVRTIREQRRLTQSELAGVWRRHGLNWARSKISALEAGRRPQVSAAELLLMAASFHVPLSGLLAVEAPVRLEPYDVEMPAELVARLLTDDLEQSADNSTSRLDEPLNQFKGQPKSETPQPGEIDANLARQLAKFLGKSPQDFPPNVLVLISREGLGGRTLEQERDRRLEGREGFTLHERRALRGHETRRILAEMEQLWRQWKPSSDD